MKALFLSLLILLTALPAFGQSTTLNGTVTDMAGQTWNNGTFTITFVPATGNPGPYTWTGGTLQNTFSGVLSATGTYSISIPSNTAITPGGSMWQVKVCPQATANCFTNVPVSITGTTFTLNLTPPGIVINLQQPLAVPFTAYNTNELTGAAIDSSYYNLTALVEQFCQAINGTSGVNCTQWTNRGAGGGPGSVRLDQVNNQNQNKLFDQGGSTLGFTNGSGLNLSGETTGMFVPSIAGCTLASPGQICYDSTNSNFLGNNGTTNIIGLFPTTVANQHLAGFNVAGGKITMYDAGAIGNTTGTGTPTIILTNVQENDSLCWSISVSAFINCTEGVPVTVISATTYTPDCLNDRGSYLLFNAATAITVTLPQPSTSTPPCDANFFTYIRTLNASLTINATSSTISDGVTSGASMVIAPGYGTNIFTDNINYFAKVTPYRIGSNTVSGGLIVPYNTTQTAGTISISATTMYTTPAAPVSLYEMSGFAEVTVVGTSCVGNTTVVLNAIYTNPAGGASTTQALGTFTVTANGALTNNFSFPPWFFRGKVSTAIQFSTTYTAGGSCSPAPTVQVTPILKVM